MVKYIHYWKQVGLVDSLIRYAYKFSMPTVTRTCAFLPKCIISGFLDMCVFWGYENENFLQKYIKRQCPAQIPVK